MFGNNRRVRVAVVALILVLLSGVCVIVFRSQLRSTQVSFVQRVRGQRTVRDCVAQYGDAVRDRLATRFEEAGVPYPPERITLAGLKAEEKLEVWVRGRATGWKLLRTYPVLGMSGSLGPKLKQGDRQVPEGIYGVESLNPNSSYHLSLRLNYPNRDDRRHGESDGRTRLGSDIMIHGKNVSIGCLAMGDEAAEDLFVLAALTGVDRITVILSPVDFRVRDLPQDRPPVPDWVPELYESIRRELSNLSGDRQ